MDCVVSYWEMMTAGVVLYLSKHLPGPALDGDRLSLHTYLQLLKE
jgi:hypothetical protein